MGDILRKVSLSLYQTKKKSDCTELKAFADDK